MKSLLDPRTERRRRWDQRHMLVASAKVHREVVEQFRVIARKEGLTIHGALKKYICRCVLDSRLL
jgi:RNase P subunit RPR2